MQKRVRLYRPPEHSSNRRWRVSFPEGMRRPKLPDFETAGPEGEIYVWGAIAASDPTNVNVRCWGRYIDGGMVLDQNNTNFVP